MGGKGVGEEGVEGDDTPMRALARVLLRSRERLTDYGQAQVLCGLGRGEWGRVHIILFFLFFIFIFIFLIIIILFFLFLFFLILVNMLHLL